MSEILDKVMRKIAAMEADGWDMSDFRTALAAEVKRREEAEAELSTKDEFIADLCKAHDASLAALRKQVVELEVHLDNQAKANIEMHNVKETFQYAANKQVAELTAANERLREALDMLINFIPDGWEMPLGYAQIVAQAQAAKEAQDD